MKNIANNLPIIEAYLKVVLINYLISARKSPKFLRPQNSPKYHQVLMQKTGDLISELVVPEDLETAETEVSIEVNLDIVKFKYTVKKKG